LIDDYGFADASYKAEMYNGTNPPPTPHIDALAKAGVRLESYYVNKLCSPTRTALLSGRYAYTNGMDDGVIIDGQNIDMPLNVKSIADYLQEAGWNTSGVFVCAYVLMLNSGVFAQHTGSGTLA
jgi:arylsulfatase A-like enzyme